MVMEMSKTYQYRKVMKPLLERKRRARINKCLDDLKDLMVECLTQEGEHVTRLEKADILELTVEHMRKLKQRGNLALQTTSINTHVESFRSGYVHAADQISQVLLQQYLDEDVKGKLMKFLSSRLMDMQHNLLINNVNGTSLSPSPSASPSPPTMQKTFFDSLITRSSPKSSSSLTDQCVSVKDQPADDCCGPDDLKENDMIDIITVDNANSMDSLSVLLSADSQNSESVWRPWQKPTSALC